MDKLEIQNTLLFLLDFLELKNPGFSFIVNKSLLSDPDIVCMASLFKGLIDKKKKKVENIKTLPTLSLVFNNIKCQKQNF